MKKIMLLIFPLFLLIYGCGLKTFVTPNKNPSLENRLQKGGGSSNDTKINTLALNPERRLFITKLEDGSFCAEYPTEVGLTQASSSALKAAIEKEGIGKAELKKINQIIEDYSVFNRRSQSVQMFLASSYYVCQLYLNKSISEEGLLAAQLFMYEKALISLKEEAKVFYEKTSFETTETSTEESSFKLSELLNFIESKKTIKEPKEESTDEGSNDESSKDTSPDKSSKDNKKNILKKVLNLSPDDKVD